MERVERCVLVAEDDPAQQECLEEVLVSEGWRVLAARDPVETITHLTDGPDVVLLDMVGILSPAVLRALDRLPRRPGVVLVSGDGTLPQVAQRIQADAFLRKPYGLQELLDQLERVWAQTRTKSLPQRGLALEASLPL